MWSLVFSCPDSFYVRFNYSFSILYLKKLHSIMKILCFLMGYINKLNCNELMTWHGLFDITRLM